MTYFEVKLNNLRLSMFMKENYQRKVVINLSKIKNQRKKKNYYMIPDQTHENKDHPNNKMSVKKK